MTFTPAPAHAPCGAPSSHPSRRWLRRCGLGLALASALVLGACGGGDNNASVQVGVVIGGRTQPTLQASPGTVQQFSIYAGDSFSLEANESVTWTLEVGGTGSSANGSWIYASGLDLRATSTSRYRVTVDTSQAYYYGPNPIPVTFYARANYDGAVVATVKVWAYPY